MRVITGKAKGRNIETLEGIDVRPTSQRVKEGIFSAIQFRVEGRSFLDLFAGSGQMGIEALSRGAKKAVFVDESKKAVEVIKKNLQKTDLQNSAEVVNTNSLRFLDYNNEPFDIIFLDPPYGSELVEKALEKISKNIKKTSLIICETSENCKLPLEIGNLVLDRNYRYGKIKVDIYCHRDVKQ